MGYPSLYAAVHKKQWARIRGLSFPAPVSRKVRRDMARKAARKQVKEQMSAMRSVPLNKKGERPDGHVD